MSEMKCYEGKLVMVKPLPNETLEEQCKRLSGGRKLERYYESFAEKLCDTDKYVVCKNRLYKIVECEEIEEYKARFNSYINSDGSIDFNVKYYNGGLSFQEALKHVIKKIKIEDEPNSKVEYYKNKLDDLIVEARQDGVTFTTEQIDFFNSVYVNIRDSENNKETVRICDLAQHTITKIGE